MSAAPSKSFSCVWGCFYLSEALKTEDAGNAALARLYYVRSAEAFGREGDRVSKAFSLARAARLEIHPLPGLSELGSKRLQEANRILLADGDETDAEPCACEELPQIQGFEVSKRREALKLYTLATTKRSAALAQSMKQNYAQAQIELRKAAAIFHDLGCARDEAEATSLLAISLSYMGSHPQSLSAFTRARSLYESVGLSTEAALVRGQSSGLLSRTGNREAALEVLDAALGTGGVPCWALAWFHWQRGLNREKLQGLEAALPDFSAACQELWKTSESLTAPGLRADFLHGAHRARIVQTAVAKFVRAAHLDPAHARTAFEILSTHKGRVFSDLRQNRIRATCSPAQIRVRQRLEELDRQLGCAYESSQEADRSLLDERRSLLSELKALELDASTYEKLEQIASVPTLDAVLQSLPEGGWLLDVAVLKYMVVVVAVSRELPDGLALFVLVDAGTADARLQRVGVDAPCPDRSALRSGPQWLERANAQFNELTAQAQRQVEAGEDARALYEDVGLLEQLGAALVPNVVYESLQKPGPHELLICADSRVSFPFSLLRRDGKYLIERVDAVSLVFATTQVAGPDSPRAPTLTPASRVRFFVAGEDPTARALSLADLETVLARCSSVVLYSGSETNRNLRIDDAELIHIAAEHGVVDADYAGYSRLVLNASSDADTLSTLSVSDLLSLDFPPAVAVLAACSTLNQASGPGQIDLAQALLVAGCSEIVGSQWTVLATESSLMQTFLDELLVETTTGARYALAKAQRKLIGVVSPWIWAAWGATYSRRVETTPSP